MMEAGRLAEIAALVDRYSDGDGIHDTAIPGVRCLKASAPGAAMPVVYQPSVCIIVQGSKRVLLQDEIYHYAPSDFLAVSVDLPVSGEVTEGSATKPFLCLQVEIDAREFSDVITQMRPDPPAENAAARGVFIGKLDSALTDSVIRLATLLDTPKDIPLLAPMRIREVYYRLLNGEYGSRIAQIGIAGSNMQRIARVVQLLKTDIARARRIEELAEIAGMSSSSFHYHFKEVTAMTPLQYQKRLRLMEARRILLSEEADASSAAYRVGYESPSQFSREYSRLFGAPPVRDVEMLRQAAYSRPA